jgi:hypothetical protein
VETLCLVYWNVTVQSELTKRATAARATTPTGVPTDLRSTVQSVTTYLETVKAALGDNKLGKSELQAISVAGANAVAGLQQFAGAQGQTLANAINTMTQQLSAQSEKQFRGAGTIRALATQRTATPTQINVYGATQQPFAQSVARWQSFQELGVCIAELVSSRYPGMYKKYPRGT